jgi:hypothetical protein
MQTPGLSDEDLVEQDCVDQGFSAISEGCFDWRHKGEPLVQTDRGWKCHKCGMYY